jgi:hypothetical protein
MLKFSAYRQALNRTWHRAGRLFQGGILQTVIIYGYVLNHRTLI